MDEAWHDFRDAVSGMRLTEHERTALADRVIAALAAIRAEFTSQTRVMEPAPSPVREVQSPARHVAAASITGSRAAQGRAQALGAVEIVVADKLRQHGKGAAEHFIRFDYTGNGKLSADEFGFAVSNLGVSIPPDAAAELCTKYDSSGDGLLDFGEFAAALERAAPTKAEAAAALSLFAASFSGSSRDAAGAGSDAPTARRAVPQLSSDERVVQLRQAAGAKLLRRHGTPSHVWRAAHRASAATRSPASRKGSQSGVSVAAVGELLRQ